VQFLLGNVTLVESLSEAASLVIKSLLNPGILLLQGEFEEIWPEQPKKWRGVGIGTGVQGCKHQQRRAEKTVRVTAVKQMTKIHTCSRVLKFLFVQVW